MDLGSVFGMAAEATGFGDELNMASDLLDTAAPLLQLVGEAAPLVALVCPAAAPFCALAGPAAQLAQQVDLGNGDEKAKQSAKSGEPTQLMAKSEEVAPRSAERRETSGRERSETVSERHREPAVSDHRTGRETGDHRPVRDHRTDPDVRDHRGERPEHRVTVRNRREADDRFEIQPGDSFLIILAKALAGEIDDQEKKIEADAKSANGTADNQLIAAETQEFAQAVSLANTIITTVGQADKTAAGQPA